jgi:hypothetical protein
MIINAQLFRNFYVVKNKYFSNHSKTLGLFCVDENTDFSLISLVDLQDEFHLLLQILFP